mmetsp:Transcript_29795/g.46068  ORF Transcript_29795/g.46068 Transcript_29795/m.46068 type:complete len:98 (+) Transcript_29795:205-498(+)
MWRGQKKSRQHLRVASDTNIWNLETSIRVVTDDNDTRATRRGATGKLQRCHLRDAPSAGDRPRLRSAPAVCGRCPHARSARRARSYRLSCQISKLHR